MVTFNDATKKAWQYLVGRGIGVDEIPNDTLLRMYMEMDGIAGDMLWPGTVSSLGNLIKRSEDFGLKGDGTNEFATLRTFLQSGGILIFEKDKTYNYVPTTQIVIPPDTLIIMNGAKFYETSSADGYWWKISSDTRILGTFDVSIAGNVACRGVNVQGDNITIDGLRVTVRAWSAAFASLNRQGVSIGLRTGDSGTPHQNIYIGNLELNGWQHSAGFYNCDGLTIDNMVITNTCQGLYICDSKHVTINQGINSGQSAFIKGNPGENSIIMESTIANDSTSDIMVRNFRSMISGEHGFRLGGLLTMKNITFYNCYATKAGSGIGTGIEPDNHGGCGFKVLGPTTILNASATHNNIRFIDCIVEDLYTPHGPDSGNFVGFQIGKSENVHLINPIVRAAQDRTTYARGSYAAYDGIRILGSSNVTISNPHISECENAGIIFYDQDPAVYNWGAGCTFVNIVGGIIRNNPYGIKLDFNFAEVLRNVKIDGTSIENATYGLFATATTVAASLSNFFARFSIKGSVTANISGAALTAATIEMYAILVTPVPAVADGSVYISTTGRYVRQRGAWYLIAASGTTANRPNNSFLSVGQEYYDTTIQKPVWFKAFGAPNVWIDAAGNVV